MTQELECRKDRLRFEPIEEWFFPAPVFEDGHVVPAPKMATEKYEEMSGGWLKRHAKTIEIPMVRLHPVREEGKVGYIVQIGIVYPPSCE